MSRFRGPKRHDVPDRVGSGWVHRCTPSIGEAGNQRLRKCRERCSIALRPIFVWKFSASPSQ